MALAAAYNLELHHLDIQTTFLHGDLEEEVYMQQPPYYEDANSSSKVCRLQKSIYGLRQSPRAWYHRLHIFFINKGYTRLKTEPSIYMRKTNSTFILIGVYVDDLSLLSNSMNYLNICKQELKVVFPITDLGPMTYFLGIDVNQNRSLGTISLSQSQYITNILKRFDMLHCKPISTPLIVTCKLSIDDAPHTTKEHLEMKNIPYKQIIGCVRYLVTCTRPDLCFSVGLLSRFMQNPGSKHWQALKRVLRYLKHTQRLCLTYTQSEPSNHISELCD